MVKHNQNGSINGLFLVLIVTVLLLIGAVVFGGVTYSGEQKYKNDQNQAVAAAISQAKSEQLASDTTQFTTEEKSPLQVYDGPEAYGSIVVYYPKSWSGYVDGTGNGQALVDGYFYPGIVPALSAPTSVFALRVQVQNSTYSSVAQGILSQQQNGTVKVTPYSLPKVPKIVGMKVVGHLGNGKIGTEIVLPVRSETILLWTEGTQYVNDFNTYVLPNFSFSP